MSPSPPQTSSQYTLNMIIYQIPQWDQDATVTWLVLLAGAGGCHPIPAEPQGYRHLCPRHQLRAGPRLPLGLPDDAALYRAPGPGGEDLTAELHLRSLHRKLLQRHLVIRSDRTLCGLWLWLCNVRVLMYSNIATFSLISHLFLPLIQQRGQTPGQSLLN